MPKRTNDGLRKRCDCPRKTWAKCDHGWYLNFHHGGKTGKHWRLSLDAVAHKWGERPPRLKTDAEGFADRVKVKIRSGEDPTGKPVAPVADLTVGDVINRYLTEFVGKQETPEGVTWNGQHLRAASALQADYALRIARACEVPAAGGTRVRFEQKPLAAVTKADLEAIRALRRPFGVVGCNRLLARLRHFFNWAISEGFVTHTPFKREGVSVVKLEMKAEAARTRRLQPGERENLIACASPHLRALIEAALSTGCRVGELLSLQWHQVRYDEQGAARWFVLPARKTKTNQNRTLPIGSRLRAELAMRRHAPDGEPHPPNAYVFGNECGDRIASVKRAWEIAVLKAHGHAVQWVKGKPGQLAAECRAALHAIDLHFHDLRREFACTLLETGAAHHDVQEFLGHGNITTTSRYLKTSPVRLAAALSRMEGQNAPRTDDTANASDPASDVCTPFAQTAAAAEVAAQESLN